MKKSFLIIILLSTIAYSFERECANENETNKYLSVPLIYDLNKFGADLESIPKLNQKNKEDLSHLDDKSSIMHLNYKLLKPLNKSQATIFILPGGPGNFSIINMFSYYFPSLVKNYNLIEMSHRGTGCSVAIDDKARIFENSLLMRYAASDIEFIRRTVLGNKKIHIYGSSYGALLAQTYMLMYPNGVDRVFLRDVSTQIDSGPTLQNNLISLISLLHPDADELIAFAKHKNENLYFHFLNVAADYFNSKHFRDNLLQQALDIIRNVKNEKVSVDDAVATLSGFEMVFDTPEFMTKVISCRELLSTKGLSQLQFSGDRFLYESCKKYEEVADPVNYKGLFSKQNNTARVFLYNGFWDPVTTVLNAENLSKEIRNSYLFIDKLSGHGELANTSCMSTLLSAFYSGRSNRGLDKILKSSSCR